MSQLGPRHIPRTPLACRPNIPEASPPDGEEPWLHCHTLCAFKGRSSLVASPGSDDLRIVALLQAERVCLQLVLDVVGNVIEFPWVPVMRIPPIQVVRHDFNGGAATCRRSMGRWRRHNW